MSSAPEYNVEAIPVTVITRTHCLEGMIHLSRTGKDDRRLTNLLNSDRRFLALTGVKLVDRLTGEQDSMVYPFIEVNITTIELIKPHVER